MENTLTWADLKKAIDKIPEKHLEKEVIIWTDDERLYHLRKVLVCKEDYIDDDDGGCWPKSQMKDAIEEGKLEGVSYSVSHKKGTRILIAE